ncbi:hypothetical protein JCM19236_1211 [Vibrio sp. JCM 19236]|nr:hypothetical protein JCM19236_1211 [Vibrio sp. JCM 19236]
MENKNALEKVCRIRKLDDKHNFTLLCRDLSELLCLHALITQRSDC